ncbi:BgTH12-00006 [Blumeria graminis f. sp. triticale]|uniref:BgtE-10124 n=3 Tax=Blumeria graminis TaxID=34373 RepID=A0A9X9QEZ2_BLUGR|nr:putative secreted effector protein [Blumeria graminis f. sp. tritici 96224]CAD6504496.1 BgTH12-00006 [Blumeria graminis f. sp. triticale]VDB92413.1 BgtE-10124 [Blumeria graminis f. sp. tritici]
MYSKLAIVNALIAISQLAAAGSYTCYNRQTFTEEYVNTIADKCFGVSEGSVGGYPMRYENLQLNIRSDSFRKFPLLAGGDEWSGGAVNYFVASDSVRQTKRVFYTSGRFDDECAYTR